MPQLNDIRVKFHLRMILEAVDIDLNLLHCSLFYDLLLTYSEEEKIDLTSLFCLVSGINLPISINLAFVKSHLCFG